MKFYSSTIWLDDDYKNIKNVFQNNDDIKTESVNPSHRDGVKNIKLNPI